MLWLLMYQKDIDNTIQCNKNILLSTGILDIVKAVVLPLPVKLSTSLSDISNDVALLAVIATKDRIGGNRCSRIQLQSQHQYQNQ